MTLKNKIELTALVLGDSEHQVFDIQSIRKALQATEVFHVIATAKMLTASTDYNVPELNELTNIIHEYITASQNASKEQFDSDSNNDRQ